MNVSRRTAFAHLFTAAIGATVMPGPKAGFFAGDQAEPETWLGPRLRAGLGGSRRRLKFSGDTGASGTSRMRRPLRGNGELAYATLWANRLAPLTPIPVPLPMVGAPTEDYEAFSRWLSRKSSERFDWVWNSSERLLLLQAGWTILDFDRAVSMMHHWAFSYEIEWPAMT